MDIASLPLPADDQDEPFVPDLSEGPERGIYLALFELLDEGVVITGDEIILEVNSAACRHLERSYGELAGQPLASLFPSEEAFLAARARVFIQGQRRGSLRIALPGGHVRDMRFSAATRLRPGIHALVLTPDGPVEAGSPTPPADRLWPRLAAALDQAVLVVDPEKSIAAANAAALRRLRRPRPELVGRPLGACMAVRWPADGEEPVADLRLPDGETLAARALPGPKPGWRLLILPAREAGPPPPLATAAAIGRPAESTVDTQDLAHRALQASLAQALARHQLEVHVAPEWRLGASRPAAEALLRWRHPELGLIPCGHLLPVLRQGDLLRGFGAWTLAQACAQAARWAAQGRPLPLVVNVALEQLIDPAFPGQLREILAATGLDPGCLELDVEETFVARGDAPHVAALRRLAELGVGLAIDNFGHGPSSILGLGRLPLSRLRLDPAFVRAGLAAPGTLKATLAMARALGLEVVAKGVDDAAAQVQLVELGCTALQGRHIGPPVEATEFAQRHLGLVG